MKKNYMKMSRSVRDIRQLPIFINNEINNICIIIVY